MRGLAGIRSNTDLSVLGANDRFKVEAAIAIGRMGDKATLSEALQAREAPSPRKPVEELAFAGRLPG
ncbi:NAD(P)H-flavin oxidoreductase [Novosphingobium olei]|uniref:NAD(P)H-flavin oxidoreductase n=1 Tax=Novosphingobium olei TaxID=2728851 RepID=A0A7Y0BSF2_9SPHN|nr:NAD(P)H-flavin oxidoreductase [Novosphingobium olei]NML95696.1 NAD(P)H-flavin oxidoreductase [Novosphingobium olei]